MEAEGEDLADECGEVSNAVARELPCLFQFIGHNSALFSF